MEPTPMTDSFLTILAISAVVIVTPGQDTALTIKNTLSGQRRGGVMTALGVSAGQALWALATAAGLVAFLVASEPVFAGVKLAGACYLAFLGVQSLYSAFRRTATARGAPRGPAIPGLSPLTALRQGLLSNLGNPKMAVFFASLLPQFVAQDDPSFAGLVLLGLVFCTMTFAWLTAYAFAITVAGAFMRRAKVRRTLVALTGTALLAMGLHLARSER